MDLSSCFEVILSLLSARTTTATATIVAANSIIAATTTTTIAASSSQRNATSCTAAGRLAMIFRDEMKGPTQRVKPRQVHPRQHMRDRKRLIFHSHGLSEGLAL